MIISGNMNTARYQSDLQRVVEPVARQGTQKASEPNGLKLLTATQNNPSTTTGSRAGLKSGVMEKTDKSAGPETTEKVLQKFEKALDKIQHNSLEFTVHEKTGRTVIKVVDTNTKEVIKQLPPEDLLDLAAKLEEMSGVLFDKKI